MKTKEENQKWYFEFDLFWEENYSKSFLWVDDWQQWVQYQDGKIDRDEIGYFKPVKELVFRKIVKDWLDLKGINYSGYSVNKAKDRITQDWFVELADFDTDLNIRNVRNGLLNLETKRLTPHKSEADYLTLRQANVFFKEESDIKPTPRWDSLFSYYKDMPFVEWGMKCIIFNNMSDEKSVFLVGPPRAGKGSTTDVLKQMYADGMYSNVCFHDLARDFHIAYMAGKTFNIDTEAAMMRVLPKAIMNFKKIVGRDGYVSCNPKGKSLFDYKFIPFFFWTAMNQLFQLPPTDPGAFFVRVVIAEMKDKPVETDIDFKPDLLLEVDDIFSKLIYAGYVPFSEVYEKVHGFKYNEDDYKRETAAKWEIWSEPVAIACRSLFQRSKGVEEILVDDVLETIINWLSSNDYVVSSERSIKIKMTRTFARMNIKRMKKQRGYVYAPIEYIGDPDNTEEKSEDETSDKIPVDYIESFDPDSFAVDLMDWLDNNEIAAFSYNELIQFGSERKFTPVQCQKLAVQCEKENWIKKDNDKWFVI